MSVVNSIQKVLPGFGSPCFYVLKTAALAASGDTTQAIGTPITNGYVRVKWSGPAVSTTAIFNVTVTDGTTVYQIFTSAITAAGASADYTIPFNVDIGITSITVTATLAGAATTGTLNYEVAGNP